jgi:hypothetical protein
MDELTMVRGFRDSAPAAVPAALRERALGVPPRRTPTRRTALSIAVAAAVALTGGGLAVATLVPASPSSAAVVLGRAAQALLDADPGPMPEPHDWLYTVSYSLNRYTEDEPVEVGRWKSWTRFDGDGYAEISPITHRLDVNTGDYHWPKGTPSEWYTAARTLPEDPDAVLQALRDDPLYTSDGATEADRDFDEVTSMLTMETWLPPSTVARLYQALAIIPGVGIDDHAAPDMDGRPVLSITYSGALSLGRKGDRWELLLDPETYQVTGLRGTAGEDFALDKGPTIHEGTVWYEYVLYERRVVAHAGDTH